FEKHVGYERSLLPVEVDQVFGGPFALRNRGGLAKDGQQLVDGDLRRTGKRKLSFAHLSYLNGTGDGNGWHDRRADRGPDRGQRLRFGLNGAGELNGWQGRRADHGLGRG